MLRRRRAAIQVRVGVFSNEMLKRRTRVAV